MYLRGIDRNYGLPLPLIWVFTVLTLRDLENASFEGYFETEELFPSSTLFGSARNCPWVSSYAPRWRRLARRRRSQQATAHHDHGEAAWDPEERLQQQPQASEACEGTAGAGHGPWHARRAGLVPEQVSGYKLSQLGLWRRGACVIVPIVCTSSHQCTVQVLQKRLVELKGILLDIITNNYLYGAKSVILKKKSAVQIFLWNSR